MFGTPAVARTGFGNRKGVPRQGGILLPPYDRLETTPAAPGWVVGSPATSVAPAIRVSEGEKAANISRLVWRKLADEFVHRGVELLVRPGAHFHNFQLLELGGEI